jgi:hypothetical protein
VAAGWIDNVKLEGVWAAMRVIPAIDQTMPPLMEIAVQKMPNGPWSSEMAESQASPDADRQLLLASRKAAG